VASTAAKAQGRSKKQDESVDHHNMKKAWKSAKEKKDEATEKRRIQQISKPVSDPRTIVPARLRLRDYCPGRATWCLSALSYAGS
jgi:hypothetical protein